MLTLPGCNGTDTVIRPSLGEQAKNLGIRAAGAIGDYVSSSRI